LLTSLPEPCRTIVVAAVLTGLRIGEVLALRWKNLDMLRGRVLVRETVSEGLFGSPKIRSSRRDVPMSQPVCKALVAQRGRCRQAGPEDLVFATRKQTPLNPKNPLRRELHPACIRLKLLLITWHSFRHTHATLLGELCESLRTAQAILWHSDLKTTLNVYMHAIPESQRRAVNKVADVLFPNVPKFEEGTENGEVNWLMLKQLQERWSRGPDLNRGPVDYESTALPTELPRPNELQCSIQRKKLSNHDRRNVSRPVISRTGTAASRFRLPRA
jgi:hypothetical protein